ncbi:MAG: hypothetical protein GF331_24845 [Chitinivibrionales bacterium]|nr:hypothetical protein [Chitinivibrionales bacterium]
MNTDGGRMGRGLQRSVMPSVLVLLVLAGAGRAQAVSGAIASDTTWSGTVQIEDSVWVTAGAVLTVAPGTQVTFGEGCGLTVIGAVQATGTEADTIVFTAADTSVGWRGLRFPFTADQADTSSFAYCRFEHAVNTATYGEGGSLYIDARGPMTFANCMFRRNNAYRGAGINAERTTLRLSDCVFVDNEGESYGTALCGYGPLHMTGCTIEGNVGGSAIRWAATSEWVTVISRCSFVDNRNGAIEAHSNGADVFWITGCLFRGNSSQYDAGAIRFDGSNNGDNLQVVNCTFVENVGHDNDHALYCLTGVAVLTNCILWDGAGGEVRGNSSRYSMRYCCIKGGFAGIHVIDTNPLFTDSAGGDFSLADGSPCIDAGSPMTALLVLPDTDLATNPRIAGACIDIGAYEHEPPTATREPAAFTVRPVHRQRAGHVVHTLLGRAVREPQSSGWYVTAKGLTGQASLDRASVEWPGD